MADITPKDLCGCLGAIFLFFLSLPLWYVLLFWVLTSLEAPGAIWACYWIYVPSGIISALFSSVGNQFSD